MNFLNAFASLFSNFGNLTWQMVVMWGIGALLIYLAIAKKMEPSLLLPMGFGAILVNLPLPEHRRIRTGKDFCILLDSSLGF